MKPNEIIFAICVTGFAVVFAGMSLWSTGQILEMRTTVERGHPGAAGQPRDVNAERILDLIRQQRLSDHEAEYYGGVGEEARPPCNDPANSGA